MNNMQQIIKIHTPTAETLPKSSAKARMETPTEELPASLECKYVQEYLPFTHCNFL